MGSLVTNALYFYFQGLSNSFVSIVVGIHVQKLPRLLRGVMLAMSSSKLSFMSRLHVSVKFNHQFKRWA